MILEDNFDTYGGVGQGTIVDGPDGRWWGVIFQDRGAIGRVPVLMPCRWVDGWPMLGNEQGHVDKEMDIPYPAHQQKGIVASDDFGKVPG